MKTQCTHCLGDYMVNKDGQLRKHDCRRFHTATGEWTYGPRDAKGRGVQEEETVTNTVCCDHASMHHGSIGCDRCGCITGRSSMKTQQETVTNTNITPEVIKALATLRNTNLNHYGPLWDALNVLDNAGIFAAIDEATGYDVGVAGFCNCADPSTSPCIVKGHPERVKVSKCTCPVRGFVDKSGPHTPGCPGDPEPEPVSKCTCPGHAVLRDDHNPGCPGDPAEWCDMAFTTAMADENKRMAQESTANVIRNRIQRSKES